MGLSKRVGEAVFFVAETVVEPLAWPGYAVLHAGMFLTEGLDYDRRVDALRPFAAVAHRLWSVKRVVWRPIFCALVWSCPALLDDA